MLLGVSCYHDNCLTVLTENFKWLPYPSQFLVRKSKDQHKIKNWGNSRPIFSLGVARHMHKITNLWKFELNWLSKLIMEEKTQLSHDVVCFQMLDFGTSKSNYEVLKSNSNSLVENYFFLKNYTTSKGAVSQNVFILSTVLHCLLPSKFYANNYFE